MKTAKAIKTILGILLFVLPTVLIGFAQEIAAFFDVHSLGFIHDFLFGHHAESVSLANTPALLTQFSKQVEKRPKPNNGFLQYSVDESDMINGDKVVRPVEGDDPVAVTDPKVFPLPIEQNDDDSNEYPIKLHATKPQRISDAQSLMLNYNLRQGIIDRHMRVIEHKIAREILYNWSPTLSGVNVIGSTGANVEPTLKKWGAAGHRKAIAKDNIIDGVKLLKEDDVEDGTLMLVPVGFTAQIFKGINDFVDYEKTGRADLLAQGFLGQIMGARILQRSTAVIYDENGVPQRVVFGKNNNKFTVGATHCQGILIWNPNYVYKAIGKITPYLDPVSGALLGSTVNFSQRGGGNIRKDQMGVVAVTETFVD